MLDIRRDKDIYDIEGEWFRASGTSPSINIELLGRLAVLTPRPRINLVLYYGVPAPSPLGRCTHGLMSPPNGTPDRVCPVPSSRPSRRLPGPSVERSLPVLFQQKPGRGSVSGTISAASGRISRVPSRRCNDRGAFLERREGTYQH